jgi:hypothetical protein
MHNSPTLVTAEPTPQAAQGLTWRALILACLLTFLCGFWVRQAEIVVVATQVSESVPAIPALAALVLLILLNPLVARLGRAWRLSSVETLSIYCFVAIGISISGCGVIRYWLASLGYVFYFARPENEFGALQQYIPGWMVPREPGVILQMYERSPDGRVPWGAWAVPLLVWSGFFLTMWVGMLCTMVLVRKRWTDEERLTYPIVQLPLEMIHLREQPPGQLPFFRDRVMWIGFGLAFAYNAINMAHALWPIVPTIGNSYDLNPYLTRRPWKAVAPFWIWYRPELVGFGFLVSTEMAFSIWFFFVLSKIEGILLSLRGFDVFGVPFEQEQSIGAYLLLGLWLLWMVRRHLAAGAREMFVRRAPPEREEALPRRWALLGLAVSFIALCAFCRIAGMMLWVAVAYLGIIMLVALVSARIRAEAGVPLIWLFPFYQQKKVLLYTLGSNAFLSGSLPGTATLLALFTFLSRGYFPALIGYQAEDLKIAREARMKPRHMAVLIIIALLVGLFVAYYFHLTPYYKFGGMNLRDGIWGTSLAGDDYRAAASAVTAPQRPDSYRITATVWGFFFTAILALGRRFLVGFPFHPFGYAVATAYGDLLAPSFFVVWLTKGLLLRFGGMRLYRRAIPGFLGLALGHFFTAGVIWGLLGAYGGQAFRTYGVWFG